MCTPALSCVHNCNDQSYLHNVNINYQAHHTLILATTNAIVIQSVKLCAVEVYLQHLAHSSKSIKLSGLIMVLQCFNSHITRFVFIQD